jgi:hypothetical protein
MGGINTYSYVAARPVNAIDPSGLIEEGMISDMCNGQPQWLCDAAIKKNRKDSCIVGKFFGRTTDRFVKTNKSLWGTFAPPGMGIITGGAVAEKLGVRTMMQETVGRGIANYAYFATGKVQPPINWSGLARGMGANFFIASLSFEAGAYAGSAISTGINDAYYGASGAYEKCECEGQR